MLYGPPWHIGGLQVNVPEQEGKWAAQRLPTGLGESRPTANFGGTGQCITEQSQNQDIAYDLIAAGNLSVEGNLYDFKQRTVYPSYIPTYERPELQGAIALLQRDQDRRVVCLGRARVAAIQPVAVLLRRQRGDGSRRHHAGDDQPGRARAGTCRSLGPRFAETAELALLTRPETDSAQCRSPVCGQGRGYRGRDARPVTTQARLDYCLKTPSADAIMAPRKSSNRRCGAWLGKLRGTEATAVVPVTAAAAPRARTGRAPGSRTITPYLFLAPFFIVYSIFLLYPVIDAFLLSFNERVGISTPHFVGLQNYLDLLHDERYLKALLNTTLYALASVFILSPLALLVALAVRSFVVPSVNMRSFYRVAFFLPNITSFVVIALMFGLVFDTDFGLLNAFLEAIGQPTHNWLRSETLALPSIVLVAIWTYLGINSLYFLAGLQNIPDELSEAAQLDGAEPLPGVLEYHAAVAAADDPVRRRAGGHLLLSDLRAPVSAHPGRPIRRLADAGGLPL